MRSNIQNITVWFSGIVECLPTFGGNNYAYSFDGAHDRIQRFNSLQLQS